MKRHRKNTLDSMQSKKKIVSRGTRKITEETQKYSYIMA